MASYRFQAPSSSQLADGGLFSLSGLMALFCGLLASLVGLLFIFYVVIFLASQLATLPDGTWSWHWGKPSNNPVGTQLHTEAQVRTWSSPGSKTVMRPQPDGTYTRTTEPLPADFKPDPIYRLLEWLGFLISAIPLGALAFGLAQASACFVNLARRRYFDRQTIHRLRNFALGGLIFLVVFPNAKAIGALVARGFDAVINPLRPKWITVVHTMATTTFNFDGFAALPVIYALTLTVIAWVMAKAAALAEDHAQIV